MSAIITFQPSFSGTTSRSGLNETVTLSSACEVSPLHIFEGNFTAQNRSTPSSFNDIEVLVIISDLGQRHWE